MTTPMNQTTTSTSSRTQETNVLSDPSFELACRAFELLGTDRLTVSANLDVAKPQSLANFAAIKKVLLMAYREGQSSIVSSIEGRASIERQQGRTTVADAFEAAVAQLTLRRVDSETVLSMR